MPQEIIKDTLTKINEMLTMTDGAIDFIRSEAKILLNQGVIDFEKYSTGYRLAKIVLTVSLINCSYQYRPFDKEGVQEVNNLLKF